MRDTISAVAFDIDGTLYPAYRQSLRLMPFVAAHLPFMIQFSQVRSQFHAEETVFSDFYAEQSKRIAERMHIPVTVAADFIHDKIYHGWESVYRRIRLHAKVSQVIENLRTAGLRTAILSDFPPEPKLSLWNIDHLFDVILGCEEIGALKPSPVPFLHLADVLQLPPQQILYVGNKVKFDVVGAKKVGMQTALITAFPGEHGADIEFRNYTEFENILLH